MSGFTTLSSVPPARLAELRTLLRSEVSCHDSFLRPLARRADWKRRTKNETKTHAYCHGSGDL